MTSEFESHRSYQDFAFSVTRCWRYLRTADDNSFTEAVLATSQGKGHEESAGQTLWRAQIGCRLRELGDDHFPVAFCPKRMKPPSDWQIEGRAPEGRINPKASPSFTQRHMREPQLVRSGRLAGSSFQWHNCEQVATSV